MIVSAGNRSETLLYAVLTADEPVRCEVTATDHLRLAFRNTVTHLWGSLEVPVYRPVVHRSWSTRSVRDAADSPEDPRGLVHLDDFFRQELLTVVAVPRAPWLRRALAVWT